MPGPPAPVRRGRKTRPASGRKRRASSASSGLWPGPRARAWTRARPGAAALDRVLDTAERGELDALAARQRGEDAAHNQDLRAWSLRNQVQSAELEARALREKADADYLGGLRSTLLNGAARTGRNFYNLGVQGPGF